MSLRVGDKLGPYEVIAPLGKGGMGEVYRALDSRIHREVAIKTSSERFTERFEREARAIASLNHPNVCTLYDVGPDYLVMELIEGPTLAERIGATPIPLDESLKLAAQIADALTAAHRKGVIHRDLKPANIKIKPDGTVKVLDFGLAKVGGPALAASDNSPTLSIHETQAGVVLGTAAYMSPEQAKGKPVDKGADIWAFGVVLYEMLTGKQLHQGESVSEVLAAVLKETPDLGRVPVKVRRLLRSCLQKDPEQRLHEIADWKLLLDDDVVDAPPQVASRARWLWPSVAALLLLAAAVLGVMRLRETPPVAQEVRSQIPQPEGLTFNPGTQAAISPDGRWLAFAALGPDNVSRMYIRSIDSLEVRPLQGSEGIIGLSPPPFWSYDSRFVVYGALGKLKKSDVAGTPAQTIAETGLPFLQGGSWSRDGVILYAKNTGNLEQVESSGGTPAAVTALAPGETAHRWPQFLPDGRRFLYLRVTSSPDKTGVYVGSLDVKPDEQNLQPLLLTNRQAWWVTSESSGKSLLLMQRDEALLAQPFDTNTATLSGAPVTVANGVGGLAAPTAGLWSVARNGALVSRSGGFSAFQLTWVDLAGRTVGTVEEAGISVELNNLALSPDGQRIAFAKGDAAGNRDIWIKDIARGANTKLTFDARMDDSPVWSPDGTRIVFAANRGGRMDLYEKNADGSGDERLLLKSDQDKVPTSWSRDGRFLLFTSLDPKTRQDLWVLPLEGTRKPFVFLGTEAIETLGQFSPDQRWIAYFAVTGNVDVFVRPFSADSSSTAGASGAQWMISTGGALFPRWSADGKRLFYISASGDLMAADVQAGVSFQNGPPQRLFGNVNPVAWSVSPAGDRFLFARTSASAAPPPFTMVLNWMARLEQ
jgi:serine/threonine protein kinase